MGGGRWRRWQETAPSPPGRAASGAPDRRCFGEGLDGRNTSPCAGAAEPLLEPRRADAGAGSVGGEAAGVQSRAEVAGLRAPASTSASPSPVRALTPDEGEAATAS